MVLCFRPSDQSSEQSRFNRSARSFPMGFAWLCFLDSPLGSWMHFLKMRKILSLFFLEISFHIYSWVQQCPLNMARSWVCNLSTGLTVRHTDWPDTHAHGMNHRKLWLQNVQRCAALDSLFMVNGTSVHQGYFCVCVCHAVVNYSGGRTRKKQIRNAA